MAEQVDRSGPAGRTDDERHRITEEVLARFAETTDPRVREISVSLVRNLHAFIQEVRPTHDEWEAGIAFLTAVGHACTEHRQEFILLSDTLGASMLVEMLNAPDDPRATDGTVLGPFYVEDPPSFDNGARIDEGASGTPLFVSGRVTATDGTALAGAVVDTWQSDAEGRYDVQSDDAGLWLRGRFSTDEHGGFQFWSVVPSSYPIPDDGPVGAMLRAQGRHPYRPAHVHFRISCPGYRTLTTHVFVAGDPYLESDAVFGVRSSLIEDFVLREPGSAPPGRTVDGPFAVLERTFELASGA